MMTSTKAVKMLIATTHNSPFQDSPHPDNQGFYGPVLRGLNVMPCDFRYWVPFWTGWLHGTNSLGLMCKFFFGCRELKTQFFFLCNQYNKRVLLEIKCTLLIFDYY